MIIKFGIVLLLACGASSLYDSSDDVIELTDSNFNNKVIGSDEIWFVEFYAPWCGHCKNLAPEWKKAASMLKGVVKVGAVDMDTHSSVGSSYGVRGFPTIKTFGRNKGSPGDYNGGRTAQGIVDEALKIIKDTVKSGGKSSSGSSSGSRSGSGGGGSCGGGGGGGRGSGSSGGSGVGGDVVELTDSNFEEEVLQEEGGVLVEFFAPWCGHCQRLAPEWAKAATELKGKIKVTALDATAHQSTASRFQVQGYPTIKFFPAGAKDWDSAQAYEGGRTSSDIVAWALQHYTVNVDPPEIMELTSNSVLAENCNEKPLCIVTVLDDILESGAEGRNQHIEMLSSLGEKYKQKMWGWVWTASGVHPNLEKELGIGGFGYPALAVVNVKKKVFVLLRGQFSKEGVDELIKYIVAGRGRSDKLSQLPTLSDVPAWDGKDGQLPVEEDIDLSDVELDDLDSDMKDEL